MIEADRQVATDQAAQARAARWRCASWTRGRPVAVAMGRTEPATRLPEEDVIDRASRLLRPRRAGWTPRRAGRGRRRSWSTR